MVHFSELKDESDAIRVLFDQVLSCFLKRVSVNKDVIRVFPPKIDDGLEVDLFTLFWVVRKLGDFELVSKNKLWEFVAEECGLGVTHVESLKLIYIKYLKELNKWLNHGGFKDSKSENRELGVLEKLDSLFRELKRCKCSLSRVGFEFDKKGNCGVLESSDIENSLEFYGELDLEMAKTEMGFSRIDNVDEKDEEFGCLDLNMAKTETRFSRIDNSNEKDEEFGCLDQNIPKTEMGFSRINNFDEKDEEFGDLDEKRIKFSHKIVPKKLDISRIKDDDDDKRVVLRPPIHVLSFQFDNDEHGDTSNNQNKTVILAKNIVKNVRSRKRKKVEPLSLSKMLDWVANVARNPHDVTIGSVPKSSKWKKYKGNEVWKHVLLIKETLFAKRNVDSGNKVYVSQKKRHKMHPSMYEDDKIPIHLSSKRIRCSQRASSVKSCSCPGCTSSQNKRVKKIPQILETIEIQDDVCEDLEIENVTIRAEVPKWTGVASESDPKWLGTRMWPALKDENKKHETGIEVIGKGRSGSCACRIRGSVDCVRLHIYENRTKIKHALGTVFYKWKFNRMGEGASVLLWSLEEETEFKNLVIKARQELSDKSKSRHEIMSNFWRRASESIPLKTKDALVSYYFNVFVLRRRSYQNRIMPEHIDSDDDEQEVGYEKIPALSIRRS